MLILPDKYRHLPPEAYVVSHNFAVDIFERFTAPIPTDEPFDWCIENVEFDDSEVKGPFNPTGREYMRDMINDANDPEMRQQTLCCSTGIGKTARGICIIHWKIVHHPCRGLFILPKTKGEGGSETYVTSRLMPSLKKNRAITALMPDIQERLFMNSKKVRINGAHWGFVGSNSTTDLGSNRCGHVEFDELDKMKFRLGNEAGSQALGKERVEGVEDYQIYNNSTPTGETGGIWKSLTRSDFRRRFLPCPGCNSEIRQRELLARHSISESNLKGWFALAWNQQYCVLPSKFTQPGAENVVIPLAYMHWDKEAKNKQTGDWDEYRVFQSARMQCPHCGFHILDQHRLWMDKNGLWLPTQKGEPFHKGYHLSSLYAPLLPGNENSTFGGRALKFFSAHKDGDMKAFINSTLAEVDVHQAHGSTKIEINSVPLAQSDWVPLLTADFQKNWPYLWFVVRKWCSFHFLPPFPIVDGLPSFAADLERPENAEAAEACGRLMGIQVGRSLRAAQIKDTRLWNVLAEIARMSSSGGLSPLIKFLIENEIVGEKLLNFYHETAGPTKDIAAFRKGIYKLMSEKLGKPIHCPRGGDSELVAAGYCEESGELVWTELRDIAAQFEVGKGLPFPNKAVSVDCGYAEKFNREVLRKCFETGTLFHFYDPVDKVVLPYKKHNFCLPVPIDCWMPTRGKPVNKPLGSGKINHELHLNCEDPFFGSATAGSYMIQVLEMPSTLLWVQKDHLRQKKTKNQYAISPEVQWFPKNRLSDGSIVEGTRFRKEDYEKQVNEQFYDERKGTVEPRHGRGGSQSKLHPYHIDDCEVYQYGKANFFEFFDHESR